MYRFKNKTKQEYTFWDYFAGSWQKNYGMRIDHFLLSNSLIENMESININKKPRSKEKTVRSHANRTRNYLTLPYIS